MHRIVITNEHGPDLELEGELLIDQLSENLGQVEIWRTSAGRYVVRRRQWAHRGRPYFYAVQQFDALDALAGWLGFSAEAKQICERLGYRNVTKVD